MIRFYIGLEDPEYLKADLEQALKQNETLTRVSAYHLMAGRIGI